MTFTKSQSRRPWCIRISVAVVVIIIIIVIVVPLAVILPKRNNGNSFPKSAVLIPLYIYPANNTSWGPLYDAVQTNPHLNFTVIVNPSSGPGKGDTPDSQYSIELQKLNGFPNVETVGYVRTGYATRDISTVISEVGIYGGWSSKSSGFAMHGIFFDEAPHEYVADAVTYMATINQVVKNSTGLQGRKTIIHNPGTIPDSRFNDSNTDITVVFEESYPVYQTAQTSLAGLPSRRANYSYMINAVPMMGLDDMTKFVDQLSLRAEYLFLTNNDKDFYESWGPQWTNFTSVVPT